MAMSANSSARPVHPQRRAGAVPSLLLTEKATSYRHLGALLGRAVLLLVTSSSAIAVLFIFYFIARDALPFFRLRGFVEFFTGIEWYPSHDPPSFGALPMFVGTGLVTLGAVLVAVPLGVAAAVCLSDVLPFALRQVVKPVVEILAAIPSVAYGFFALVVLAPLLQEQGGTVLAVIGCGIALPLGMLIVVTLSDYVGSHLPSGVRRAGSLACGAVLTALLVLGAWHLWDAARGLDVATGVNAFNASLILGIMALPTVVSVSEDALQAVGRELREGSYALGATRAETLVRVVLPAAGSGIAAAVILGVMRAVGETMVVWMASGNATQIPSPWYNYLQAISTLTAAIARDMGEADHVTGSERYHVLFAMALCLLVISLLLNLASEWAVRRTRRKLQGQ